MHSHFLGFGNCIRIILGLHRDYIGIMYGFCGDYVGIMQGYMALYRVLLGDKPHTQLQAITSARWWWVKLVGIS